MKFHPAMLALLATPAFAADSRPRVEMPEGCALMIRTALGALDSDWLNADDGTGNVTIDKDTIATETISNVRILSSSCKGPDDCDATHPDAFTYGATIGKTGRVVVSYHRGHCFVSKFSIN